jgi:hypothetical protein
MGSFKRRHQTPLPTHPYLTFKEYAEDDHFYEIYLVELEDKDLEHNIRSMMNASLDSEKREKCRCWLLAKKDVTSFIEAVKEIEQEDDKSEDESDSTTDDELIQKALARRMKSETSSTVIEDTNISDSEMEDVLSLSRRIRYLMRRISYLEKQLEKVSV